MIWIILLTGLLFNQDALWPIYHSKMIVTSKETVEFSSTGKAWLKGDTLIHVADDVFNPSGMDTSMMLLRNQNYIEYGNSIEFRAEGYYLYPYQDTTLFYIEARWNFSEEVFEEGILQKIRYKDKLKFTFKF